MAKSGATQRNEYVQIDRLLNQGDVREEFIILIELILLDKAPCAAHEDDDLLRNLGFTHILKYTINGSRGHFV